ncbi:hypothetical protein A8F94_01275 [Bacillus sp. FJAT-27225]|uniref:HXXEE domain-containing protein n=1 Tax=Bacillus sp. FJAT-27225 TaxID=1743144 RepID=UPI00080C27E2|nr:HXXEE domain-containing protein [Bacillus sp. FJAT-27225]OCA90543.1 hypothetical protein A8F94_01275 [Bacillus sp. FJAT-27225]
MLSYLNENVSVITLIWLYPAIFMIHDFEEIILLEAWFKKNYNKVRPRVPKRMLKTFDSMSKVTTARFSIPVLFQLLIYIPACYLATENGIFGMFIGFSLLFFLHLFSHIGQWAYVKTYTLGAGTALAVVPYFLYLFYRLLTENLVSFSDLFLSIPFGLLQAAALFGGHAIAPKILPDK